MFDSEARGDPGETERLLLLITDAGKFERLTTAVLREAEPIYRSISHPGVNADGKTVRSPVDGICYVSGTEPAFLVVIHHTTCAQRELRGKWLGGSAIIGKRHRAPASVTEAADLPKAVHVVNQERERTPDLRALLILTTNQEPTEDLVRDVHAQARAAGIEIDIWSRSRIAHFLNQHPEGQWLRRVHLGIKQERLSRTLLTELSRSSLTTMPTFESAKAWVERELDAEVALAVQDRDVTFLVAPSGLGKTTACRKLLTRHLAVGGCSLVLPHDVVEACSTLELAVEAALRRLDPLVAPGCGLVAFSLCDEDQPLLLMIEDVNRSGIRELLLEKIASWSGREGQNVKWRCARQANWRLLCPVWPETVALLKDQPRRLVESLSIVGGALAPTEASLAVQRRAQLAGLSVTPLEARSVAEAVGYDPLLIALHAGAITPDAQVVLGGFVASCARRLAAQRGNITLTDARAALLALGEAMLVYRRINPTWNDVLEWFAGRPGTLAALRAIAQQGELLRLVDDGREERLAFRHDRVREHLLVASAVDLMRKDTLPLNVMAEPFYAEIIGYAVAEVDLPSRLADQVAAANPLALFFALQRFREPSAAVHQAVVAAIERWLGQGNASERCNRYLSWTALIVLARTTSSLTTRIVEYLGASASWAAIEARLRNGDIDAVLDVCFQAEPGTRFEWRDSMLEHAQAVLGCRLFSFVGQLLSRINLSGDKRLAALRLAGHLGCDTLADAVMISWQIDDERSSRLAAYLWAGARCCGGDPDRLLGPICKTWAALPASRDDGSGPSPRDNVAATDLSWAFRDALPVPALRYFIQRAASDDLRWQITYMLRGVDAADALEFIAREMAAADERSTEPGGAWHFADTFMREWNGTTGQRRKMSGPARFRLRGLWENGEAPSNLRKRAFGLWVAMHDRADRHILWSLIADPLLGDRALAGLLERGDRDAVPLLIGRLNAGDARGYWWQFARHVFGAEFVPVLDHELSKRREKVISEPDKEYGTDWIVSELLIRLPTKDAEQLLVTHWNHLRLCADFVQTALYVGTPHLIDLVQDAVDNCQNPPQLFEHVDHRFGNGVSGHLSEITLHQLVRLLPYLRILDPFTIYSLWDFCNKRGWYNFRREHLDQALTSERRSRAFLDEADCQTDLDRIAESKWPHIQLDWSKRFLEINESKHHLMNVVERWLTARGEIEAFKLAAVLIAEIGDRSDLDILRRAAKGVTKGADAILADTVFRVERKTLT